MLFLVVDDDDYAAIVTETLRRDSHEVVIAGSSTSAIQFAQRRLPDMAIIDVMLPDGSGLEVGKELRSLRGNLPIIYLSGLNGVTDICAGFDAGADDYIVKPFHPSEFIRRVRAVAKRANGKASTASDAKPSEAQPNGLEMERATKSVFFHGRDAQCSPIEFDILQHLVDYPGEVLTHEFLNEQVWGYSSMDSGTLLKGHVSALRRKFRVLGQPNLIRTVRGVGYALNLS